MAARNRPGVSATVLAAVAMTGGNPAARSAGKVMTAAPPTIAAIPPPAIPGATSSAPWRRSIDRYSGRAKPAMVRRSALRTPWPPQFVTGTAWARRRTCGCGCPARGFRPRAGMTVERFSEKRLDAGLGAAEDQRVNVVRALVSVDGFEIAQHAHHVKLVGDAVAAMHVAGEARDVEGLAAIVALEQRHRRRPRPARFHQPPEPVRRVQAERDFGLHVGELLLHELIGGERTAELLAIEHVLAR